MEELTGPKRSLAYKMAERDLRKMFPVAFKKLYAKHLNGPLVPARKPSPKGEDRVKLAAQLQKRRDKGETVHEIARSIGYSPGFVSNLTQGRRKPKKGK